jgi:hypothetical protein
MIIFTSREAWAGARYCLSVSDAQGRFGDATRLARGSADGWSKQTIFLFLTAAIRALGGAHAIVTYFVPIDSLRII